jgi:hypothetical protein
MATKRTGRDERGPDAYPLNDKPRKPSSNTFPKAAKVDLRALGAVGVRIATERALGALHAYGDEVWELLGVQKLELARRRNEIITALRSIVADVERSGFVNRSGAVALLGEIGGADALPELLAVLGSPYERRSTRGWAAVGIGRCGGERGVELLRRYAADVDPLIRRKVIDGLEASRSPEAIPALEHILANDKEPAVANRAHDSLRRMEKALNLEPRPVQRRALRKGGGKTASVTL